MKQTDNKMGKNSFPFQLTAVLVKISFGKSNESALFATYSICIHHVCVFLDEQHSTTQSTVMTHLHITATAAAVDYAHYIQTQTHNMERQTFSAC